MIDKTNKPWNKIISDEEIFNKEFSIGYLIQSNQHLEIFQDLKDKVLSTYKVKAKFTYLGYNGQMLYANNQKLVYSKSKFNKTLSLGKNVTYLEGNLEVCGSNRYPAIAWKEGQYCIIEFISYGLPFIDKTNGWSIHILELENYNLMLI